MTNNWDKEPVRAVYSAGDKSTTLKLRLHSFQFITKEYKHWPGKKLRFTLTWYVNVDGAEFGQDIEGCLATRTADGKLVWSPPLSQKGKYYRHYVFNSPALHKHISDTLSASKYAKHLGTPTPGSEISTVDPHDIDPELPRDLEVGE